MFKRLPQTWTEEDVRVHDVSWTEAMTQPSNAEEEEGATSSVTCSKEGGSGFPVDSNTRGLVPSEEGGASDEAVEQHR